MRGPIDYIIVGFQGNNFTGNILKELEKAANDKTIAVLALAVIARDKDGNVAAVEVTDPEISSIIQKFGLSADLISDEDVQEVGELLEDNTAAGLLVIEQLWAKGLKQAIIDANGTLINEGRIHPEASKELDKQGA
jgi:uncharacterized membrane protein